MIVNATPVLSPIIFCLTSEDGSLVGNGPAVSELVDMHEAAVTVNEVVDVTVTPLTVTAINPDVAPVGISTVSCVAVAAMTVAVTPLMVTVLFEAVVLKFVPVIINVDPGAPLEVKLEIVGSPLVAEVVIVKSPIEVAMRLFVVTVTLPVVVPPEGTVTVREVSVAPVTTATAPFIVTVLEEIVELKFVPVMVTEVPTSPLVGLKLVMVGLSAESSVTSKSPSEDVVLPFTVTVMGPVVAPVGTVTVSCVLVAVIISAEVPLNLTELLLAVKLKLEPVMVTVVPSGPLVGEKEEMAGAATTSSS